MKEVFRIIAGRTSKVVGSPWAFVLAVTIVIVWALTGSVFDYSNTWQLFINTGTTIVTFLMVFLIHNAQNRDSKALQLKLDELVRVGPARDKLVDIEDMSDEEISQLEREFQTLAARYHAVKAKKNAKKEEK